MSDYVVFQMLGPFRQSRIDRHLFYVEQARKRLLSQFDDIDAEADRAPEEWLELNKDRFDPDQHEHNDFYEAAYDWRIKFHELLSDMRDQTRLSVLAGMFHEWDKHLRDWLVFEIKHWHHGNNAALKVWSATFEEIVALLESFGWNIQRADFFYALDACHLVVNVYKHGNGQSLDKLKEKYPNYLDDRLGRFSGLLSGVDHYEYTNLKVNDNQFKVLAAAIVAFWQEVPENVYASQVTDVPKWFEKVICKDNQQHSSKK